VDETEKKLGKLRAIREKRNPRRTTTPAETAEQPAAN
jgi:hypothetical protein